MASSARSTAGPSVMSSGAASQVPPSAAAPDATRRADALVDVEADDTRAGTHATDRDSFANAERTADHRDALARQIEQVPGICHPRSAPKPRQTILL